MAYIPIGTLTKPHGINGAVHVKADTDFKDERFKKGQTLYLNHKGKRTPVHVSGHFQKKNLDVLTFEEISDIDQIEVFRGATLEVAKKDRAPLDEDDYYFDDLIGLAVFVGDALKGKVVDVVELPQGAALRIDDDDKKTKLVPFMKTFVETVDLDKKQIFIKEIEGLL